MTAAFVPAPSGSDTHPLDVAAVADHLARHGLSLDRARGASRLSGGLSNLNYLVFVDGRKAVFRRPPPGDLPAGAYDMGREHRVLSRLPAAFAPAPVSFHLCEDLTVIGVPFQLLEHREGLVVRGDTLPPPLDGNPDACRALSLDLVATLTALHAVDAEAIGLGGLGRPEGFYERTVAGWMRRADDVTDDERSWSVVERIGDWLARHRPAPLGATLLHSDFKLDNCMLDADLKVATVLDWDMGTRGDPQMDLATLLSYWAEPGDPDCMHRLAQMPTARPGFLTRAQVVETYAGLTGRPMDEFAPWRILAMLKLGIVFLQLHSNWARGLSGDEGYAGFKALGHDLLDFALASLDRPI